MNLYRKFLITILVEMSPLKNQNLFNIGAQCVEYMKDIHSSVDLTKIERILRYNFAF